MTQANKDEVSFNVTGKEVILFPELERLDISQRLSENAVSQLANTYSLAFGADYNSTREFLQQNMEGQFKSRARSEALMANDARFNQAFEHIVQGSSVEEVEKVFNANEGVKERISNTESPELAQSLYTRFSEGWDELDRMRALRLNTLAKHIDAEMAQTDTSFWGLSWDVVNMLFSTIPEVISGGGFTRVEQARELIEATTDPSVSEEEFNKLAQQTARSVADTGFLTDHSPLFIQEFNRIIQEGARGFESDLARLFTSGDYLIAGGALVRSGKGLRTLIKSRDAADTTQLLHGQEAATEVVRESLGRPNRSNPVDVAHRMYGDPYMSPTKKTDVTLVAPDAEALKRHELTNNYLDAVLSNDFAEYLDPDLVRQATPAFLRLMQEEIAKTEVRRVNNIQVYPDRLGNLWGELTIGKVDGAPIKSKLEAQKRAKQFGGEVIEGPVIDGRESFWVSLKKPLPTKGLVRETDPSELSNSLLQAFGSTFLTTSPRLDPLIKRAEASLGNVYRQVNADYTKVWRKAHRIKTPGGIRSTEVVNKIFERLRDGTDSFLRTPYSETEFRTIYREMTRGVEATPEVVDVYFAAQKMMDVDYVLRADPLFKQATNNGEQVLVARGADGKDLTNFRVIPTKPKEGNKAINVSTNEVVELSEDTAGSVYRVIGGYNVGDKHWEYVLVPNNSTWKRRRLYHSDVLGYNPGGHREYKQLRFLVKQEQTVRLHGGPAPREVQIKPITFMGTVTEAEARTAADLLEGIRTEVMEGFRGGKVQAQKFMRDRIGNPDLDDFVRSNNAWNPDIEDVEDLVNFFDEMGLDPRKKIGFAADGEPLRLPDGTGNFDLVSGVTRGMTEGDAFRIRNNPANGKRRDKPLLGYGGSVLETRTPIERTENSFVRSIQKLSEQAYLNQAGEGWWLGAKKHVLNRKEIEGLGPLQRIQRADVSTNTKEGKLYEQERKVIMRRLAHKPHIQEKMEQISHDLADWVYEKGYPGKAGWIRDQFSTDPTVALRGMAFNLKLGLFAADQLLVQASQAINILAIAGSRNWREISTTIWPLRLALHNGNESVIRDIGRRSSAFTGLSEDEFFELATFMHKSGRQHVGHTVIEQSGGDFALTKGALNKFLGYGRIFFNEGELIPREAAMIFAFREFKSRFPGANPFSDAGRNYIMRRQDVLTAGMTQSSAAAWQKNGFSIPLQFMSYTSRMMEQIFIDSGVLTRQERLKLVLGQFVAYGATGFGLGGVYQSMIEEGHISMPSREMYTLFRYGMLDGVIAALTDANTSFSERLGVLEGTLDMYERIWERDAPWYEIVGGPSGQAAGDIVLQMWDVFGATLSGKVHLAELDFTRALRNVTSVNRGYTSWYVYHLGNYYSRNGNLIAGGLSSSDALFAAMGAPLQEVNLAYDAWNAIENEDDYIREHGRKIQTLYRQMTIENEQENYDQAKEIALEIAELYQVMPPHIRRKLKPYYRPQAASFLDSMIQKSIERRNKFPELVQTIRDEEE